MARSSSRNNTEDALAHQQHREEDKTIEEKVSYCTYLSVSLTTGVLNTRTHSSQNVTNHSKSSLCSISTSSCLNSPPISTHSNISSASHRSNCVSSSSSHASRSASIPRVPPPLANSGYLAQAHSLDRLSIPTASRRAPAFSDPLRLCRSRPCSPPPATYIPARRPSLSLPPSPRSGRMHRASLPFLTATFPQRLETNASSTSDLRGLPVSPSMSRRRSPRRTARTPSPRPPLPPGTGAIEPLQQPPPQTPQRSRPLSQPYKAKMRSR